MWISFLCVFCVSLDHFIPVLLAIVDLPVDFFFRTKPRDWLGRTSLK